MLQIGQATLWGGVPFPLLAPFTVETGPDCGDFGGGVGRPSLEVGEEATRADWS